MSVGETYFGVYDCKEKESNLQSMKTKNNKINNNKGTALYCRLSKEDDLDSESNSIKYQKDLLLSYAHKNDLRFPKFYVDDGYSGTDFDRPGFQNMIEDIEKGEISTVLVKDMSRLGRNHLWVGIYTEEFFPKHNVRFIAIHDDYDTKQNNGLYNISIPIKNLMNEWYAADTSRKVKASKTAKGMKGVSLCAIPPYGYLKDPNNKEKWIIDEKAAPVVRNIFMMTSEGIGPVKIAEKLEKDKVLTPKYHKKSIGVSCPTNGKETEIPWNWSTSTIYNILSNQAYVGHTVNFKTYRSSFKNHEKKIRPEEEHVVFKNTHEPIVSQDLFDQVQRMRKTKMRPTKNKYDNVFRGLIKCADCGYNLYLVRTKNQSYFHCGRYKKRNATGQYCTQHYIREDRMKAIATANLRAFFQLAVKDKELLYSQLQDHVSSNKSVNINSYKKQLANLKARLQEIEIIDKKLYEDYALEKISESRYHEMTKKFVEESNEIQDKIDSINEHYGFDEDSDEKLRELFETAYDKFKVEKLDKKTLNNLFHFFVVSEDGSVKTYFKGRLDIDMDAFVKLRDKIYEEEMAKLGK